MRTGSKNAPPNVETAYELYGKGEVEQARKIINDILEKSPNHLQARALRDRMDNDEFKQFNVQTRELQTVGEINPVAPWGWFIIAVGSVVIAVLFTIPILREMYQTAQTALAQTPEAPAALVKPAVSPQVRLIFPVALGILAAVGFINYRRLRNLQE